MFDEGQPDLPEFEEFNSNVRRVLIGSPFAAMFWWDETADDLISSLTTGLIANQARLEDVLTADTVAREFTYADKFGIFSRNIDRDVKEMVVEGLIAMGYEVGMSKDSTLTDTFKTMWGLMFERLEDFGILMQPHALERHILHTQVGNIVTRGMDIAATAHGLPERYDSRTDPAEYTFERIERTIREKSKYADLLCSRLPRKDLVAALENQLTKDNDRLDPVSKPSDVLEQNRFAHDMDLFSPDLNIVSRDTLLRAFLAMGYQLHSEFATFMTVYPEIFDRLEDAHVLRRYTSDTDRLLLSDIALSIIGRGAEIAANRMLPRKASMTDSGNTEPYVYDPDRMDPNNGFYDFINTSDRFQKCLAWLDDDQRNGSSSDTSKGKS